LDFLVTTLWTYWWRILAKFWTNFGQILDEFWPNFGQKVVRKVDHFWTKNCRKLVPQLPKEVSLRKSVGFGSELSAPVIFCGGFLSLAPPHYPSHFVLTFCRGILVIMLGPNMSASTFSCLRGIFCW
jgi:hypothetical protein